MAYYNIFYMGLSRGNKLAIGIIYKRHLQVFGVSLVMYGGLSPSKKHKQKLAPTCTKSYKKVAKICKKVHKTY